MSFDPNTNQPPMGNVQPKKSGAKWWLIGCFTLLLLCGGGLALVGYPIYKIGVATAQAMTDAKTSIENSEEVKQILGAPIEVGQPTNTSSNANGDQMSIEITYPVKGSEKSGEVTATIKGSPLGELTVDTMELTVDGGETHTLNSTESLDNFDLNIKDGN